MARLGGGCGPMTDPRPVGYGLAKRVEAMRVQFGDAEDVPVGITVGDRRDALWSRVCPSLYLGATIDDLPIDYGESLAGWALQPEARNVVLAGAIGTGKTHAALAVARTQHERGLSVAFWPMVELWDALRPGGDPEVIGDVCHVDVLVLDDMGAEKPSDWTAERLFLIVNRRALDQRSTVVTSNLVGRDLRLAVGDRVYDRLVNERTVTVVLEGGSRRGKPGR